MFLNVNNSTLAYFSVLRYSVLYCSAVQCSAVQVVVNFVSKFQVPSSNGLGIRYDVLNIRRKRVSE